MKHMYLVFSTINIIEILKHIYATLIIARYIVIIIIDINMMKMLMIVLKTVIQYGIVI